MGTILYYYLHINYFSMKTQWLMCLYLFVFVNYFGISIKCELTNIIKTDKGPVRGEIFKSVGKSIKFASFRGIPYGKAPVGYLRFKVIHKNSGLMIN